jgi:malate synthase
MTWEERGMASDGVEITGPKRDRFDEVLTPGAVGLVAALQRELGGRRTELLAARAARVFRQAGVYSDERIPEA